MQIDYIRRDVNEAISEDGGAFIQLVNKNTVGLKSSIDEAKSALYVVGAAPMIEGYFVGIMRSVFEGIREDGHPRTVGDITFYPVCGGTFDLDKGWDPKVNDVRIYARLINGVTLDISDWTFRDVTEGRVAYSVDTVSNGSLAGLVSTDRDTELNGRNFPAKEKLTVSWSCGLKGGVVPADKFTANVARITVDKSVLSSLTAADDGKNITWTVKGCYNKASKTAILKYVAMPTITKIAMPGREGVVKGETFEMEGTNLAYGTGDTVKAKWTDGTTSGEQLLAPTTVTATKMTFAKVDAFDALPDNSYLTFEVTVNGITATKRTTLLPALKHVVVSAFTLSSMGSVSLTGTGFEALEGFSDEGTYAGLGVTLRNGTKETSAYLEGPVSGEGTFTGTVEDGFAAAGDTIVFHSAIDPNRTDYDQTPVEKSCMAS